MSKHTTLSWAQRFALIEKYSPTDEQICNVFGLSNDELSTARSLHTAGRFGSDTQFDAASYVNPFNATASASAAPAQKKARNSKATVHTKPATTDGTPETATRRSKVPQKRGRKGDKIQRALLAVPTTPISVDQFCQDHSVSIAVLRQSRRFIKKMDKVVRDQIGEVKVRQDKTSKQLMIWREVGTIN